MFTPPGVCLGVKGFGPGGRRARGAPGTLRAPWRAARALSVLFKHQLASGMSY